MPDREQSKKGNEPSGRPLKENEWMELMNACDHLSQYAKRRREERGEEK